MGCMLFWTVLPALILGIVFAEIRSASSAEEKQLPPIDYDVEYSLPVSNLVRRGAGGGKQSAKYRGYSGYGYGKCDAPEGLPGSCKPLATCAQYYATAIHYKHDHPTSYKSCTFGLGYRGECCPDVYYQGKKPAIINYDPKRDYDGNYAPVHPEGIQNAVKYATDYVKRYFYGDQVLCKDEDDPSYWGNGITQAEYNSGFQEYADTGFFFACITEYLQKHYGYKPQSYFGANNGIKLLEYGKYLPEKYTKVCQSYYKKCYPSKYRSIDGSCNNLKNPYYGLSKSAVGHIRIPRYSDNVHKLRYGKDGSPLPPARYLRTHALPDKNVEEASMNNLFVHYGQFITHDVSHIPFYQGENGLFIDCCQGYTGGEQQVSPKCYAVPLPQDDAFYKAHKMGCLNMARAMLAPNYDCTAGYGSQLNQQTSFQDLSLVYGTSKNDSHDLRTHKGGLMKMSKVGDQYYLPIDKDSECFRNSEGFCFRSGDIRTTIQPGITALQIIAVRFHNLCAKRLAKINPYWKDEKIYQEARRISIAVYQHITYSEYLPILLGWRFMYDHGILPATKGYSYDYDETIIPWTYAEFTAAAFRFHSSVYGKIALVDENYKPEHILKLEHHFNNALIYRTPENMDKLIRGYIWAPKRKIDEYYDSAISDHLMMDDTKTTFGLDLPTFNIHRGREYGLGTYNDYRELCGLPRGYNWKDFQDTIDPDVIERLSKLYKTPEDVDLYVGGVVERHVKDSLVGPVFWCIVGHQFQQWKWSDRYFYDLGGHPHSFTLPQLDEIRQMSWAAVLCMTTGLREVPALGFRTISPGNPLVSCSEYDAIPRLQLGPWRSGSYQR